MTNVAKVIKSIKENQSKGISFSKGKNGVIAKSYGSRNEKIEFLDSEFIIANSLLWDSISLD